MILTKQLLMKCRNPYRSGFTKDQLQLLGCWPPSKNWPDTVCGREITPEFLSALQSAGGGIWKPICCDQEMIKKSGVYGLFWKCELCGATQAHESIDE